MFCVRADDRAAVQRLDPRGGPARRPHRRRARRRRPAARRGGARRGRRGPDRRQRRRPRLRDAGTRARPGSVALVGGGPGDPGLITVRGRRLLAEADVVVADRLAPRPLLDELPADVEVIDASKMPYGRSMAQEEINALLVEHAQAGRRWCGSRAATRSSSAAAWRSSGLRRRGHPGRGRARASPARSPSRRGRHPGDPPRPGPRVHRRLRPPAARSTRSRWSTGRRSAGCAAPSSSSWASSTAPAHRRRARRARPRAGRPRSRWSRRLDGHAAHRPDDAGRAARGPSPTKASGRRPSGWSATSWAWTCRAGPVDEDEDWTDAATAVAENRRGRAARALPPSGVFHEKCATRVRSATKRLTSYRHRGSNLSSRVAVAH